MVLLRGRGPGDGLSPLSLQSCGEKRPRDAGRRKGEIPQLPRTRDSTVMTEVDLDYFEG